MSNHQTDLQQNDGALMELYTFIIRHREVLPPAVSEHLQGIFNDLLANAEAQQAALFELKAQRDDLVRELRAVEDLQVNAEAEAIEWVSEHLVYSQAEVLHDSLGISLEDAVSFLQTLLGAPDITDPDEWTKQGKQVALNLSFALEYIMADPEDE